MNAPHAAGWRFKPGIAIIDLMLGSWLMVPIVAAAGMPGSRVAALTGVLFISNKVLLIIVIAVMGLLNGSAGFGLISEAVSPGFDFADMQMGSRQKLCAEFPEHSALIEQLTEVR